MAIDNAWRELYDCARRIKEMAPWQWMSEDMLFAVVDPKTGEKGYCVVMGGVGEHLSVAIFLGDEGLHSLIDIQEHFLDPFELYFGQKCLALSFRGQGARHLARPRDLQGPGVEISRQKAVSSLSLS